MKKKSTAQEPSGSAEVQTAVARSAPAARPLPDFDDEQTINLGNSSALEERVLVRSEGDPARAPLRSGASEGMTTGDEGPAEGDAVATSRLRVAKAYKMYVGGGVRSVGVREISPEQARWREGRREGQREEARRTLAGGRPRRGQRASRVTEGCATLSSWRRGRKKGGARARRTTGGRSSIAWPK